MKSYKVAICDTEPSFAIALMNYINRNAGIPILAMAFTGVEQLREYLAQHETDMIVMDETLFSQEAMGESAIRQWSEKLTSVSILILIKSGEQLTLTEDITGISKYSPASVLVKRMLEILGREQVFIGSGREGIAVGIYSPIGRSGKSRLAHALCRYWSGQSGESYESGMFTSGRILYLGMEEYGSRGVAMETVLYYLKQRSENLSMQIKALAQIQNGVDVIPSADSYQELRELDAGDMEWLIRTICGEGYYEHVIADIGTGSLADLRSLLAFDTIYLPCLQDRESLLRIERFCDCMKRMDMWEEFAQKCYPVDVETVLNRENGIRELETAREAGGLQTLHDRFREQEKGEDSENAGGSRTIKS